MIRYWCHGEFDLASVYGLVDFPGDGVLDCKGPLSNTIAPNILAEANKEVELAATGQN